jgi:DNA-binding response OmpR family regulator
VDKIAVVDDDPDIRRLLELRLRIAGFKVVSAPDGEAGLRLIQAEKPGVIVLDSMMPKMSGMAVCKAIRADQDLRGTFIIIASGMHHAEEAENAKELGADLYVCKPYPMDKLVETIRKALTSTTVTTGKALDL